MEKFKQLCVWPGTIVGPNQVQELEDFFKNDLNTRIKYHTEVKTLPGQGGEGGRNDLFFYVHNDDVVQFSVPRLKMGIRWWEDVLGNGNGPLYTKEFLDEHPRTW